MTAVELASVTRGRVDLGELGLSVRAAGATNGRLVILLHGFPETGAAWHNLLPVLGARGYHALAPDLRGYGDSDAPVGIEAYTLDRLVGDVIALADAHDADCFDLVGHDWGGIIAWGVAARHPTRVRRLVILDAPHPDTMAGAVRRDPRQLWRSFYVAFFQLPALPERVLSAFDYRMLRRSLIGTARPGAFPPGLLDSYRIAWSKPGRLTAMLALYRALRLPRVPLGPIAVPTQILWGAEDAFLGPRLAKAAASLCDEARITIVRDTGHWLHHEMPQHVARLVIAFLDRKTVRRARSGAGK
jgi:pimeloyl-ACP methyl ester carboxylesterase